jgi:hypothetical protein
MTVIHEQETGNYVAMAPLSQYSQHDPPPYAYSPLGQTDSPNAATPAGGKTILVPPPSEIPSAPIPAAPVAESPLRLLDSHDPLSTCDARFADLILTHIILPRLRVGVLRWKDYESLEFVPQTKEDVFFKFWQF